MKKNLVFLISSLLLMVVSIVLVKEVKELKWVGVMAFVVWILSLFRIVILLNHS